ncbi:MAG: hypothetical protein ACPGJU_10385 [Coraliomargarita sp.]
MSTSHLLDVLKQTLAQEISLLSMLSDAQYTAAGTGIYESSIGMHIRHNLDHFAAFFDGLDSGRIDYESRQRNHLIEESVQFASNLVTDYIARCDSLEALAEHKLLVREEDGASVHESQWLPTSCGRELQFLLGHTVHHHAIIAMMLNAKSLPLPEGFGVAPSTQRHEQSCSNR